MTIRNIVTVLGVTSLVLLTGCSGESVSKTADDVATARQEATKDITEARADAAGELAVAKREAEARVQGSAADGAYRVAVTEAKASHEIEIEQCEALSGDARAICKDSADSDLTAAMDRAQARLKSAQ